MGQPSLHELDARCTNWGTWCRYRFRQGKGQCGSYEGDYRSPQRNHWLLGSAPSALANTDPLDAAVVERAVIHLGAGEQSLLRAHYVDLLAPSVCMVRWAKAQNLDRAVARVTPFKNALMGALSKLGVALREEPDARVLIRRVRLTLGIALV